MLRYFILTTILSIACNAFGQATLYSANFEPPFVDWTEGGDLSPNFWKKNICAGNGPTQSGSYSFYISQGGPDAGCGVTGEDQFTYTNSLLGVNEAIAYTSIDGTCASALQATFDYRIEGILGEDYAELIYSTDGGGSWIPVGSAFAMSAAWTTTTVSLPVGLNFSSFLLGVRFTYNDANVNGIPLAIDNFTVTGTDTVDPIITCPLSMTQPVDASCIAFADDYTKNMVTLSDNCTDSSLILVTQNIAEFSILPVTPGNSTTIILTAFDETGNSSQCSFTLNIVDDIDPVYSYCPVDTVIYVNANCDGTIGDYTVDATVTDNCSTVFSFVQNPPAGQIINGQNISIPITLTVSDGSGNSAQCILNALTIDTIVPTIICPVLQTQYANTNCESILLDYTAMAVVNDNCVPSSSLTVSQSPLPGVTISSDQIITLTVSNGIPSTPQTCQFTVEFSDTIRPNVLCPIQTTIYLTSTCEASIPDYIPSLGWSDNCTFSAAQMTFTQSPVSGTLTSTNQTIQLTAIDEAGNSRTCSFSQQVIDTISPQLTCPADQTLYMNSSCTATLLDYTGLVSDLENCFFVNPVSIVQSPTNGTSINGIVTITMTGTDESGNDGTCAFTVTPLDTISPTITCPANSTVNTNSGCTYVLPDVTASAVVMDNCTPQGSLIITQSPITGTALNLGINTITITVEDGVGNSENCSFSITVEDQTNPNITCPLAQNLAVDSNCSAELIDYTSLVSISDNCSSVGQLTLTQSPVSGTAVTSNTQITMTVTDEENNVNTCSFFAVVVDDTDPTVTCPSTYDIAINSSCQYLIPDLSGQVSGSDNCSVFSNMTISQNPMAGSTDGGLTAVLITLTDEQGNNGTCITLITPIDTEAPTITCPSPAPINNGSSCDFTLPNYASTALVLDNCPNYSITQILAPGTVVQPGTHVITLEVMDAGGNIAQCEFSLDINENVAPTISCPANISTCEPVVTYANPIFNDNCFAFLTQTDLSGLSSGDTFPVGITTLTYMVSDSSSNTQTCSFQVEILDFPSPATILIDTISLCQTSSTLIEALAATSGTGEWTVVSGQANFNNEFANTTGINNVGIGTNILAWTITSASCGYTSDTLTVILSQMPLPASTLDTLISCNSTSIQLSANVPLYGIGTWTNNAGATIDDVNLASSTASNLSAGWNEFVWTITNGSCPATSDTMRVFSTPVAGISQADTAICIEDGSITLNGTTPTSEQSVSWMFIAGSGEISNVQSPTTTISSIGLGTNILIYKMTHAFCATTTDTVTIVSSLCEDFNPVFPTVITPNFDGKNDLFIINYLELIYPECKVTIFNRWGSLIFESVGYQDPWDGTYNGEPLPMGTYFYKIELNDDASTVYNGPISIIH